LAQEHFRSYFPSGLHTTMSRWLVSLVICCVGLRQGQDRSYEAAALRRKHTTKTTSEHTPRPWEYWSLCEGSLSCPPQQRYGIEDADAQAEKQFLIVNSWGAGFNNERDSLEIGFALAYAWNRTLVLPPYLGNPPSGDALWAVNETWDVEAMKEAVRVMTSEEFVAFAKAHPDMFNKTAEELRALRVVERHHGIPWEAFDSWIHDVDLVARRTSTNYPGDGIILGDPPGPRDEAYEQNIADFSKGRGQMTFQLDQQKHEATALWIPCRHLLGNFYGAVFISDRLRSWQMRRAVRRSVHLHRKYFEAAEAGMAAAKLTPGTYAAMHIRQDDWSQQFSNWYLNSSHPEQFLSDPKISEFLASHGKVYLAIKANGNEWESLHNKLFPAIKAKLRHPQQILLFHEEMQQAAKHVAGEMRFYDDLVEMIICAQAHSFLGTYGSTYTGYIQRLRGYMPAVMDKRIMFWDGRTERDSGSYPSWANSQANHEAPWAREWSEGFQFRSLMRPSKGKNQSHRLGLNVE